MIKPNTHSVFNGKYQNCGLISPDFTQQKITTIILRLRLLKINPHMAYLKYIVHNQSLFSFASVAYWSKCCPSIDRSMY